MWKKRPYAQLAKCAEAQALRKAWPEIGQQATAEEMEGKYIDSPDIIERDVTPRSQAKHGTASSMNSLINAKPAKKPDEQTRKSDSRDPEEMLMAFTSAAMNYSTVSELDKAYKYIAQKLSDDDELLAKATDVYSVRREELNETSM